MIRILANTRSTLVVAIIACFFAPVAVRAQDKKSDDGAKPADAKKPAEQAKPADAPKPDVAVNPAAMAAMTPGAMHEKLAHLEGNWDVVTKFELAGQPTSESKGTTSIKIVLDGRFVEETGTGEMMGVPTQSINFWGYNNGAKKYEGYWSWTMSTGLLHITGESKDDGKTIDWDAWYLNDTGVKEEFKIKHTFIDADHHTVTIYGGKMRDGSPGPTMTSTRTRKK